MGINILGMIGVERPVSASTVHIVGGGLDPDYVTDFARVHEQAGFDAVLIGHSSSSADGFLIAQHAAHGTAHLRFLLAHRPGFAAPTQAARRVATLDRLIGGRLWLHIITGGVDADQRRDGDFLSHDERYARTDEYLDVMRGVWRADAPFDYEGRYYRCQRAWSEVRSLQEPHVPLWFGGISEAAIPVGAKHCDTYALFGEPLSSIEALIARLDREAERHQRTLRYNVSFRPIIADTEAAAWTKARGILDALQSETQRGTGIAGRQGNARLPEAETARRLMKLIEGGEIHDERLWVPIAAAARGSGNSTALVGTPDQVAEAIARYYDIGVRGVLIRGFDPYNDAIEYGRELIPAIRTRIAERERLAQQVS